MDRLSRLQALTGDKDVVEAHEEPDFTGLKSRYIYEGTDSEDEYEILCSKATSLSTHPGAMDSHIGNSNAEEANGDPSNDCTYQFGELTTAGERFVPLQAVKKYPYTYVSGGNRQRVAEKFFDQNKLFIHPWKFFYLYRLSLDGIQPAILLVPAQQLEEFLGIINQKLRLDLSIPSECEVVFNDDETPRPRYLGLSTDYDMAERLKNNIPPSYYKLDDEPDMPNTPSDKALADFRAKISQIIQAQKGKKAANKEKQKRERIEKQRNWRNSLKRVQRYLGIRESNQGHHQAIKSAFEASGIPGLDYDAAAKAATANLAPAAHYDPNKPVPFIPEARVVFVCVDVEAWERDSKRITEIGIATLDTDDLKLIAPGKQGQNWMKFIRARHFRIREYKNLNNTEFVMGCADKFEFGKSEFVNLKDATRVVASCFKHPFSKPEEVADEEAEKRNIILVGHDVVADINYLRALGYDVTNLSTLQEIADTAVIWRYLKRETNPRNLGAILAELGIVGWNLHNAGNDAVYTLQAMVAIAFKHLDEKEIGLDAKEKEKKARISEFIVEATETAIDKEEGWSSAAENSDGGSPVAFAHAPDKPKTYKSGNSRDQKNNSNQNHPSDLWKSSSQAQTKGNYHKSKPRGEPKPSSNSWGKPTPKDDWGTDSSDPVKNIENKIQEADISGPLGNERGRGGGTPKNQWGTSGW